MISCLILFSSRQLLTTPKDFKSQPWTLLPRQPSFANTRPWVFFAFFKLYEWYQIAQSTTYMIVSLSKKAIMKRIQIIWIK